MLAKKYRLKNKKTFQKIYHSGARFRTKIIGITYLKNNLDYPRFGIVISQKKVAKAVLRNRIKRIIRFKISKILNKVQPIDVIITILLCPENDEQTKTETEKILEQLSNQAIK